MDIVKKIFRALHEKERVTFITALIFLGIASLLRISVAFQENTEFVPVSGGVYIEGVAGHPIAINPIISTNQIDQDISALLFSPLGELLTRSEVDEEGRIYTLSLTNDLLWDDGERLTSDDVLFTIKTVQDPESRSPFSKNWQGVIAERISELQIKLTLPTPYIFFNDAIKKLPIIPEHIFYSIPVSNFKLSAYMLEPVGNGPYKFESFSKRRNGFITRYDLVTNKYYHKQKPFIERFYFQFYEEPGGLIQAFRLRQISGFGSLTPIYDEFSDSTYTKINTVPMPRYYGVFLNSLTNPLLKDKEIRKALSLAINKKAIAEKLLHDESLTIESPVFTALLGMEVNGSSSATFSLEEAKKAISKSKIEGKAITLTVPRIPLLEKIAEEVKNAWLQAGIETITITQVNEEELVRTILKTRNYEALLFGNVLENPWDLFPFWHSSQRFSPGLNLSLYQNTEVDTLIETIRQKDESVENRFKNLKRAGNLIQNDTPAIFLFTLPYTYIHTTRLNGFEENVITNPADRFKNITSWNMARVRILR